MMKWLRSLFGFSDSRTVRRMTDRHSYDSEVIGRIEARQKRIERDLAVLRVQEVERYRARRGGGGAIPR